MYCPYCNFRIDSYHQSVCPNCHHTIPEQMNSQMRSEMMGKAQQNYPKAQPRAQAAPVAVPPDFQEPRLPPKQGGSGGSIKLLIILLVVFLYFFPATQPYVKPHVDSGIDTVTGYWDDATSPYIIIPEHAQYVLERDITITVEGGSGHFDVHFPDVPQTPWTNETQWGDTIQSIKNFDEAVIQGDSFVNTTRNGSWLSYSGDLSDGQEVHIRLTYTVEAHAIRWDERIDETNSGTVADIPQELKDKYNHDEQMKDGSGSRIDFIEVEKYRDLAENITKDEPTVFGKVKAIYDYVDENIVYIRGRDPKACTETLEKGHGDCDDMSVVFVSLARAVGIPAWVNFGLLTDSSFSSWGGHSWVEVYIPTNDGNYVQAQLDLANNLFLVYSPTRLLEWGDNGNDEDLIHFYYYFSSSGVGDVDIKQSFNTQDFSSAGEVRIKVDA